MMLLNENTYSPISEKRLLGVHKLIISMVGVGVSWIQAYYSTLSIYFLSMAETSNMCGREQCERTKLCSARRQNARDQMKSDHGRPSVVCLAASVSARVNARTLDQKEKKNKSFRAF